MKRQSEASNTVSSAPKNRSPRWSRFVFTLNNYSADSEELIKTFFTNLKCKWLIYGREIAPTTGTPHLQGACVIGRQVSFRTIKDNLPDGIHLEPMKGTPADSRAYCSKDGDFVELGETPKPGKRNDLLSMASKINSGTSLKEIVKDDELASVFIRYPRGCKELELLRTKPRDRSKSPTVVWLYGPAGCGKTRAACDFLDNYYGGFWMSGLDLKWFDGYNGESGVILDDIRPESCSFLFLLKLLDRYPLMVPIKGGFVQWVPDIIIITTPIEPERMYFNIGDDYNQLKRRITHLVSFSDSTPPLQDIIYPTVPNSQDVQSVSQGSSQTLPMLSQQQHGRDGCVTTDAEFNTLWKQIEEQQKEFRKIIVLTDSSEEEDESVDNNDSQF